MTVTVTVIVGAQEDIAVMELDAGIDVIELVKQEHSVAGLGLVPLSLSYRPHIAFGAAGQVTSRQIESNTFPCAGTTVTGGLHL